MAEEEIMSNVEESLKKVRIEVGECAAAEVERCANEAVERNKDAIIASYRKELVCRSVPTPENTYDVIPQNTSKPGYMTTEFWVTLGTQLIGLAAAFGMLTPAKASTIIGAIEPVAGLLIMAVSAVGYAVSRGKAKINDNYAPKKSNS